MNSKSVFWGVCLCAMLVTQAWAGQGDEDKFIGRGRYIVRTSGCNDCHTQGYPESGGTTPQVRWLTGNTVGFSGPWGTTYPSNLRLVFQTLSEKEWMAKARNPLRPPMPWFLLRDMNDDDLRAIYRFVRSLGAQGEAAPAFVPPGQAVRTPYIEFVPKNLSKQAKAGD